MINPSFLVGPTDWQRLVAEMSQSPTLKNLLNLAIEQLHRDMHSAQGDHLIQLQGACQLIDDLSEIHP